MGSPTATVRDARRMVTLNDDRSGALLIRVWVESGTNELRGRLTTVDPSGDAGPDAQVTVAVAASAREVLDGVSRWLDGFTRT